MRDSRVEVVETGQPPVQLLACALCGVLLWDIRAHYRHAHLGAAPQAECDCGAGPGSAVCKKVCATRAPVLPSSTVDEEKLANLIHSTSVSHFGGLDPRVAPIISRAVAEWLKEQGGESRGGE